jgi:hypothetical protein
MGLKQAEDAYEVYRRCYLHTVLWFSHKDSIVYMALEIKFLLTKDT